MTEIEKLVAFVEQTICCGDACLCPGGDCFQSMERGKAVAVIAIVLAAAAEEAVTADELDVLTRAAGSEKGFVPYDVQPSRCWSLVGKGYLHCSRDDDEAWITEAGKTILRLRTLATQLEAANG